ncbi:(S)-ureidoglycine aminohydrolase [Hahella sp. NBU794]|uniref:(S)-ureidoglycine aminohydrolase n=1 Tax=Hahella sp. NBU794 TaxID=3422590 RepID=UPI003D6EAA2F
MFIALRKYNNEGKQMTLTGATRSKLSRNYSLMCPDSHVPLNLPQWKNCQVIYTASPEMGAKFCQFLVNMKAGGSFCSESPSDEFLLLVLEGEIALNFSGETHRLQQDGFAHLKAGERFELVNQGDSARLLAFQKKYAPMPEATDAVTSFASSLTQVPAKPFLGDDGALLQALLPDALAWDWGVNVFEFQPGATLPIVEMHFMEHGLYFLQGQGVYRLGSDWHLVEQGDAIWMGPYLEQWFAATGKVSSKYIYYKEMNRAPGL